MSTKTLTRQHAEDSEGPKIVPTYDRDLCSSVELMDRKIVKAKTLTYELQQHRRRPPQHPMISNKGKS